MLPFSLRRALPPCPVFSRFDCRSMQDEDKRLFFARADGVASSLRGRLGSLQGSAPFAFRGFLELLLYLLTV